MLKDIVEPGTPQMTVRLCMPDNSTYKPTLRMCNTYCLCTTAMVTRTSLVF